LRLAKYHVKGLYPSYSCTTASSTLALPHTSHARNSLFSSDGLSLAVPAARPTTPHGMSTQTIQRIEERRRCSGLGIHTCGEVNCGCDTSCWHTILGRRTASRCFAEKRGPGPPVCLVWDPSTPKVTFVSHSSQTCGLLVREYLHPPELSVCSMKHVRRMPSRVCDRGLSSVFFPCIHFSSTILALRCFSSGWAVDVQT